MERKQYHIAQFGTYDIESLGDTSFPKALSYGLHKQIPCTIELFSMKECYTPYNHNTHVYSFEQFAKRNEECPFDAVVLGGGEFLHFSPMEVIIDGKRTEYPRGYIWKKPLGFAADNNIPAFINCVGVSYDLTEKQAAQLRSSMKAVRYCSVRDIYSKERLLSAGINDAVLVADSLWYMNQMYPKVQQLSARQELEARLHLDLTTPYIVVQYGTTKDPKVLAQQLRDIKAYTGYRICLMAVNYCHEDRVGMQMLADAGCGEFEVLDVYLQPPEMIAVISGASAFFGTSLHGNLTAASYDVPFVGLDMYPNFVSKMDGIFSMLECEEYLVPHESGLAAAYYARMRDIHVSLRIPEIIQEIQYKLDAHYLCMTDILKGDSHGERGE